MYPRTCRTKNTIIIVIGYLPNILTVFRIGMVPVLILLLKEESYLLALGAFVLAGISDGLDGWIAKRFDAETVLGAFLDPIADKTMLVSMYFMLTLLDHIPFWLTLAVVFRDILIVGGCLVILVVRERVEMRPTYISKANTFFQILLVFIVLIEQAFQIDTNGVVTMLIWTVFFTTVVSGAHYVWAWGFKEDQHATG